MQQVPARPPPSKAEVSASPEPEGGVAPADDGWDEEEGVWVDLTGQKDD